MQKLLPETNTVVSSLGPALETEVGIVDGLFFFRNLRNQFVKIEELRLANCKNGFDMMIDPYSSIAFLVSFSQKSQLQKK